MFTDDGNITNVYKTIGNDVNKDVTISQKLDHYIEVFI